MIPRIIHCFWSHGDRTALAERCLASWRRFAPSYEIREWTLADFPEPPEFAKVAAARGKWAFVADWARFQALYDEGGLYFDVDVELVATVDSLPEGEWVAGELTATGRTIANPGSGIALERHSAVAKAMLTHYASAAYDEHTTVGERMMAVAPDVRMLPADMLSPIGIDGKLRRTEHTIGIHHYAMSWASPKQRILQWLSWHGMRPAIDALLRLKWRFQGGAR